jgi:hypothetical protein
MHDSRVLCVCVCVCAPFNHWHCLHSLAPWLDYTISNRTLVYCQKQCSFTSPHPPIDIVITRVATSRSNGMTGIAFAFDSEFEAVRVALIADVPRRVEVAALGVSYGGHWDDGEMGEGCAISDRSTLSRTRDFAIMSFLICHAG